MGREQGLGGVYREGHKSRREGEGLYLGPILLKVPISETGEACTRLSLKLGWVLGLVRLLHKTLVVSVITTYHGQWGLGRCRGGLLELRRLKLLCQHVWARPSCQSTGGFILGDER